eukprot:gb/GECG01014688.1/.p1 GENE.gb/GECG01014688.1/~~gb/GECG01014688.1/.p1  ORF type:complete len:379 (+),score=35.38 gb/GECG01014688.1/:1-1137(+)
MAAEDTQAVVIDNGTWTCKAGFANEQLPRSDFRTVVGTVRHPQSSPGSNRRDHYVGSDAQSKHGILSLSNPIDSGIITNWEEMEQIWHHTFYNELRVAPDDDRPVLLSEAPLNTKSNRERMAEVMFESFDVPALYIGMQAVLSLYTTGRTTGIILDCGEGITDCVPIYEGFALPHAITQLDVAGADLTDYLLRILQEREHNPDLAQKQDIVRQIKETRTYVALDPETHSATSTGNAAVAREYKLPDGGVIHIGDEIFRAPEALFKPKLLGKINHIGVHQGIFRTIMACHGSIQRELCSNLALSGGSTMFSGFPERMAKELGALVSGYKVEMASLKQRKYLPWIGGSMVSSLSTFSDMWISKDSYEEEGPVVIYRSSFS